MSIGNKQMKEKEMKKKKQRMKDRMSKHLTQKKLARKRINLLYKIKIILLLEKVAFQSARFESIKLLIDLIVNFAISQI